MSPKKWKIFIITHGPILDNYYANDPLFSNENFVFFNVSNNILKHDIFSVINKKDLANFIHLGAFYAESEVIYNIYKLGLYSDLDYVGFIHWDFELKSENTYYSCNITKAIDELLKFEIDLISFSTFSFYEDYNQKILMDKTQPNTLQGDGINCYDVILNDYNNFFHSQVTIDYLMSKRINLCSAFMVSIHCFENIMPFYAEVIESQKLNIYDENRKYRFQGGMLERYMALAFHNYNTCELPLYHRYIVKEEKKESLAQRVIRFFKRRLL